MAHLKEANGAPYVEAEGHYDRFEDVGQRQRAGGSGRQSTEVRPPGSTTVQPPLRGSADPLRDVPPYLLRLRGEVRASKRRDSRNELASNGGDDIAVREHGPFWVASGARGVAQQCQVVGPAQWAGRMWRFVWRTWGFRSGSQARLTRASEPHAELQSPWRRLARAARAQSCASRPLPLWRIVPSGSCRQR
eukprot:scaffold301221_cov28-Tisochrysis_lutea.AAC.3